MQTTALARIFSQNIQRSRAVGCHAISSLIIVVACSFISGARGESVFPLVRIRDQVVSVISAPSVPKSPMIRLETCLPPNETSLLLLKKRFLETPAIPTSTIRLPNIRHPIYPPPFSSRSIAFRFSDEWQAFSKSKISLFSTLVPLHLYRLVLNPFSIICQSLPTHCSPNVASASHLVGFPKIVPTEWLLFSPTKQSRREPKILSIPNGGHLSRIS